MDTRLAVLEEKVGNHIKFFWAVAATFLLCLGTLAGLMFQTKSAVNGIATLQANSPAQIAAAILSQKTTSRSEVAENLTAVDAVLKTSRTGTKKPTWVALKPLSEKLYSIAQQYPDLPQTWQTTSNFINYKFDNVVPVASKINADSSGRSCSASIRSSGERGEMKIMNCQITLEEVASQYYRNTVGGKTIPITFVNCIVGYSGGAMPDAPITFENSLFRFRVISLPSPKATTMMRQLAETDKVENVTIQG